MWAWREERIKTMGAAADHVLALFPFEPPLYEAEGIPVTYVGHPMAAHAASDWSRRTMRERLHLGLSTPVFALLPGSRLSELERHSALVIGAAKRIAKARPDARFLVPLLIPWYPLPGVLAALILDAVDQSLFQGLTHLPLEGYQAYDKALDVYYQSIAYLSTLRNWTNHFAYRVAAVLFYFRLVGVALFELTEWRILLFIFPGIGPEDFGE